MEAFESRRGSLSAKLFGLIVERPDKAQVFVLGLEQCGDKDR
jgi:hypothetical protein